MIYIDPRLKHHLQNTDPEFLIDAIFVLVEENQHPLEEKDDNGLLEKTIEKIIQQTNEKPTFLRFIPRANAVALTAHSEFINALLSHPCVQIASSATVDTFYFS